MHDRFNDLRRIMDDLFFERTVKRDHGKIAKIFPVVSITALVIFAVFLNGIPILFGYNIIYFTGMVTFGLSYLEYRLIKSLNIEYQIEITNDNFQVSKITNGKKIEPLADFSIKDCESIGSITSDKFNDDIEQVEYALNCTSKRNYEVTDDIWYVFITQEGVKYIIIFDYDSEMYPIFRRYNPRATQRQDV